MINTHRRTHFFLRLTTLLGSVGTYSFHKNQTSERALRRGTGSAYQLYGKPGNSGKNSNGTAHPGGNFPEKSNTFRGTTFFPFLLKRPKFSVPFVWITSARVHVGIL